jgi:hypothetical protein
MYYDTTHRRTVRYSEPIINVIHTLYASNDDSNSSSILII